MVLLDIRQQANGGRPEKDRSQGMLVRQVEDASLESLESLESAESADSSKTAGVAAGYWSCTMPSPGVRYYAFYGPPKANATGSPALPKAAPRYGVGGGLPR